MLIATATSVNNAVPETATMDLVARLTTVAASVDASEFNAEFADMMRLPFSEQITTTAYDLDLSSAN